MAKKWTDEAIKGAVKDAARQLSLEGLPTKEDLQGVELIDIMVGDTPLKATGKQLASAIHNTVTWAGLAYLMNS